MKNLRSTFALPQQRLVTELEISVSGESMLSDPKLHPKYTLDELLTASNYSQPVPPESREWIGASALGRELL